jgi:hypothetical protein
MAVGYLVEAMEMRGRGAERNGSVSAISADRSGTSFTAQASLGLRYGVLSM